MPKKHVKRGFVKESRIDFFTKLALEITNEKNINYAYK
jgi:hypothetical protein